MRDLVHEHKRLTARVKQLEAERISLLADFGIKDAEIQRCRTRWQETTDQRDRAYRLLDKMRGFLHAQWKADIDEVLKS